MRSSLPGVFLHSTTVIASVAGVRHSPSASASFAGELHRDHLRRNNKEAGMATATKVNLKPLEDRVVVQASEAEQTTASGLVIPDTAKEKPQQGTVIAVGPGRISDQGERIALDVSEGDTVVYSKYGGTEIKLGGEEYLILSARDILAIVQS
jgi:chaperonin GroES